MPTLKSRSLVTSLPVKEHPACFGEFKNEYVHRFSTTSNTGINLNMLQNFIFIPIDIFLEKLHNIGIESELDAWLTFLGCDEPKYIIELITKYPSFKSMYSDLYDLCQNIERVMEMWSKELQILDRNTVKYMIDELQEKLDDANATIANQDATITDLQSSIAELQKKLSKYESQ